MTRLSFVPHLKYVKQNHTNILKVISNTEWVSKLDINKTMDALCMGQLVSLTLYMLDPVHNHGLGLCLGAFRTSVRACMLMHTNLVWVLDMQQSYLNSMLPRSSHCLNVFDNKYVVV